MIQRLSTRITIQFLSLFSIALIGMAMVVYFAVLDHAQTAVRRDMHTAAQVYRHMWDLKAQSQTQYAAMIAKDPDFRTAVQARDRGTLSRRLADLEKHDGSDEAVVLASDGGPLTPADEALSFSMGRILSQPRRTARTGIITIGGKSWLAVAEPVHASGSDETIGWIVFASRLETAAHAAHVPESLSPIPVSTTLVTRAGNNDWQAHKPGPALIDHLHDGINDGLKKQAPSLLSSADGLMIAAVTPLPAFDEGQQNALLLTYPLSSALKDYHALLTLLFLIGCLALGLIVVSSLFLARSLTRPMRVLIDAAGQLESGRFQPVRLGTHDEMEELARAFNHMALAIEDRENRILHLARHDMASKLPNRQALEEHLSAYGALGDEQGIVAFAIGIDRFSHLRAVWGAPTADGLFEVIARTLLVSYPAARLARLNTDTLGFVIFLEDLTTAMARAGDLARAISQRLDNRFRVADRSLDITVTIGFSVSGHRSLTPTERLERAIIALDQARGAKLKTLAFSTGIYDALSDNLLLTEDLHTALERQELSVHYQAKYNYRTQTLDAAEALVRWNHPERGPVPPMKFVLIAEDTGYIRDLTLQVMQTVITDQIRLKAAGFDIDMSINYSGRLLNDEAFTAITLEMLAEACGQICLEITETAVIEDPKLGLQTIERFVAAGIHVSIDDFGTGLSSLAYLKLIPAQELKIDSSFIRDIEVSQKDALLVRSTIDMGHGLGMKITAEGIETPESLAMLASMGCDMAQGYGIAYPLPFDDYLSLLKQKRRPMLPLPRLASVPGKASRA